MRKSFISSLLILVLCVFLLMQLTSCSSGEDEFDYGYAETEDGSDSSDQKQKELEQAALAAQVAHQNALAHQAATAAIAAATAVVASASAASAASGFLPSDYSGLTLWLDANDASSMKDNSLGSIQNGENVRVWNDKSPQGNHVTQTNGANQPLYVSNAINGKSVVRSDGDDILSRAAVLGSELAQSNQISIFIVQKQDSTDNSGSIIDWNPGANSSNRINIHSPIGTTLYFDFGTIASSGRISRTIPSDLGDTTHMLSMIRRTNNTGVMYVDGDWFSSGTMTSTFNTAGSSTLYILYFASGNSFKGDLAEVVVYNRELSASERAQVHAYLAGKWGITQSSSIPSNIAGLTLWLDASDTATMQDASLGSISDGEKIRVWNDKSGQGNHVTQTTGSAQPLLVASGMNGLPIVRADGGDSFTRAAVLGSDLAQSNQISIFAVQKHDSTDITGSIIEWNSGSNRINLHNPFNSLFYFDFGNISSSGRISNAIPSDFSDNNRLLSAIRATNNMGYIYVNGKTHHSGTMSSNFNTAGSATLHVLSTTGNTPFKGDVAEILVYNKALSDSERQEIESYLAKKWGL